MTDTAQPSSPDAEEQPTSAAETGTEAADEAAAPQSTAETAEATSRGLTALEEEGDIAADYLEALLDIADLDGDIDIDVDGDRASVEIRNATRLDRVNEDDGELLEALQELARLAVQQRTGNRSRLMLDIGGFRASRREELQRLGDEAVRTVQETGEPVSLDPMNPFERKVVHDVAAEAGLVSESEGEDNHRHVVIHPTA